MVVKLFAPTNDVIKANSVSLKLRTEIFLNPAHINQQTSVHGGEPARSVPSLMPRPHPLTKETVW